MVQKNIAIKTPQTKDRLYKTTYLPDVHYFSIIFIIHCSSYTRPPLGLSKNGNKGHFNVKTWYVRSLNCPKVVFTANLGR